MEIYKDIVGYEGLYQVSNIGNVKSMAAKNINNYNVGTERFKRLKKEKILKYYEDKRGYMYVGLSKNGIVKPISIHRLVAITFNGHNPNNKDIVVDHINNIKGDNRKENLQSLTPRENATKDQPTGASIYFGVSYNKYKRKWRARIRLNGTRTDLGFYKKEIDAHYAYQNHIKKHNIKNYW